MRYRREIDGLRAAAVLPVILFHAGFRLFGGGFVGVDVFFVISGYLITSLILAERRDGTFALASFYERRARRILPALFFVLACCCPFAWLWMMPDDLRDFSQTLVAVATFSSNILFWIKSGYFDSASELKPLLHTWTLAVEEQYYLLFPLFLIVSWRFWGKSTVCILAALAIGSLGWAQWGSVNQPQAAFYLLQSRAWELLVGVFTAFHLHPKAPEREGVFPTLLTQCAAAAGVLLIALAVFAFDKNTPFPGVYALAPTTGAALVILYATPRTWVGKRLGSPVLVGLGLISYSAYLWHQPLFAFARIQIGSDLNTPLRCVLSIAAIVLAYFSWRFIERPFRSRDHLTREMVLISGLTCSLVFAAAGAFVNYKHGFVNRLTPEQQEIYSYTKFEYSGLWREGSCFLKPEQSYSDFAENCQRPESPADLVVVWGDSHAAALTPGLRTVLSGVVQFTASACPPMIDVDFPSRPHCKGINDFVLTQIKRLRPAEVVLDADWLAYDGAGLVHAVEMTLRTIRLAAPLARITIVGPVPQWWPSLPVVMLRKHLQLDREYFVQNPVYGDLMRVEDKLRSAASDGGASFVSALSALCRTDGCQVTIEANGRYRLMAWDRTHLTEAGSAYLARKLFEYRRSAAPPAM